MNVDHIFQSGSSHPFIVELFPCDLVPELSLSVHIEDLLILISFHNKPALLGLWTRCLVPNINFSVQHGVAFHVIYFPFIPV